MATEFAAPCYDSELARLPDLHQTKSLNISQGSKSSFVYRTIIEVGQIVVGLGPALARCGRWRDCHRVVGKTRQAGEMNVHYECRDTMLRV
jgi:hypothetical protein